MSILNDTGIRAGASGAGGGEAYQVQKSLRLNSDDSDYLRRTPSAVGNRKTWTMSFWIKRSKLADEEMVFSAASSSSNRVHFYYNSTDVFAVYSPDFYYTFDMVARDPGAWQHHVYICDTTQSTNTDRFKVYINGTLATYGAVLHPTQYLDTPVSSSILHQFSGRGYTAADYSNSYLADVHFVDGQALDASSFGELDATAGQWVPKKYTHTTSAWHAVNDGTTWSDGATSGGTLYSGSSWDYVFNGEIPSSLQTTSSAMTYSATGNCTLTIPTTTGLIEVWASGASGSQTGTDSKIVLSDSSEVTVDVYSSAPQWFSFGAKSNITSITLNQATNGVRLGAIRVDGIILTDDAADNSFHFKFDPTETGTIYSDGSNVTADSNGVVNSFILDCLPVSSQFSYYSSTYGPDKLFGQEGSGLYNSHTGYYSCTEYKIDLAALKPGVTITSLKLYIRYGYSQHTTFLPWEVSVLDSSKSIIGSAQTITSAEFLAWQTIPVSGSPRYLKFDNIDDDSLRRCVFAGIEINGEVLIDHTAIGYDSSGNKNHWNENNLVADAGTVWSDSLASPNYSFRANNPATNAFNGLNTYGQTPPQNASPNGRSQGGGSPAVMVFTPPSAIAYSSEVSIDYECWGPVSIELNGSEVISLSAPAKTSSGFSVLASGSGTITEIKLTSSGSSGDWLGLYAIKVDGVVLIDGVGPAGLDLLSDSPSTYDDEGNGVGNYCTWNPLDKSSDQVLFNGALDVGASADSWKQAKGTIGINSGKYYWEITGISSTRNNAIIGISDDTESLATYPGGGSGYGYGNGGSTYHAGSSTSAGNAYGDGDVIGFAVDCDGGTIKYYINNSLQATSNISTTTTWRPAIGVYYSDSSIPKYATNFGQRPFDNLPTGYKALNTFNLDDPTIADPSKHFDVATDTGANILSAATGLTDGADFVWIKDRANSDDHILFNRINDTGMDGTPHLRSNEGDSEATCGTYSAPSGNSVAWAWNAGTTNTSVSAGSLNSLHYNTSETWSDGLVASAGMGNAEAVFDGSEDYVRNTNPTSTSAVTFTPGTALTNVTTLEILCGSNNTGSALFELNGIDKYSDYNTIVGTGNNVPSTYVDITSLLGGSTTFTSMKWGYNGSTNYNLIRNIRVNGKVLADDDVTVTNVPSIASTVRANTTAGFSIVSYTGNGSNATIGHGLNTAPEMLIIKRRDNTDAWPVYHGSLGNTQKIYLNLDYAAGSGDWQNTSPTSTVWSTGSGAQTNDNGSTYVCYAFAPVEGYSKFGSYTANSSSDGPFCHCGFRPALVILKCSSGSGHWTIYDNKRNTYNPQEDTLFADTNGVENATNYGDIDLLSNGFKVRAAHGEYINNASDVWVWCAWAETPSKYSNAR